jgi:hypothetical protein
MNLRLAGFLTLIFCWQFSYSQDIIPTDVRNVTKLTFFNPGISYEMRIAKFQTLYVQLFMNTSASFSYSSSMGSNSSFYFDPAATIQYRYYYNGKRRADRGKRTEMNSMNYLTSVFETVFSKRPFSKFRYIEDNRRAIYSLGLAWGFQRNYFRRFSLDLNFGLGYYLTKVTTQVSPKILTETAGQISPIGQVNLGFWLNKKK